MFYYFVNIKTKTIKNFLTIAKRIINQHKNNNGSQAATAPFVSTIASE